MRSSAVRWQRAWVGMSIAFALLRAWSVVGVRPGLWNDTASYQRVADTGWFSADRWAGERPPLVPLVLELTGGSTHATVWVQTIVSIACWMLLAWVVAHLASDHWDGRRLAGGGLVFALALSPPVVQWDGAVLSESLALSTTALLVACALRFAVMPSGARAAAVIGAAVAWGACRDTHLWLLSAVGFAIAVVLVGVSIRRRTAPGMAVVGVACAMLAIAVVGTAAANLGERDDFPFSNVMAVRILPYDDRIDWFADHGMPQADELHAVAREPFRVEETGVPAVFVDTGDASWSEYATWLRSDGPRVYLEYLATHPGFVVGEPFRSPERAFNNGSGDWAFYRPPDYEPLPGTWLLFPPWWLTVLAGALATAVVIGAGTWRQAEWWVGLSVAVLSIPHALLSWHGDGMETARHALVACVQLRVGVVVMVGLAIAVWPARRSRELGSADAISTG